MTPDEALTRLHAVLAQPDFQAERTRSWWDRLWAPLGDLISSLLGELFGLLRAAADGQAGPLGPIALIVSGLILVSVVLYLARAARLAVVRESRLRAEGVHERRQRSDGLYAEAQRLAAAGHLAEAARAAYLSALYALDEHALLRVQSGLTNRELAGQLTRQHPGVELGETFTVLVQRYDRLRYGSYALTTDGFAELSRLVERARALST